MYTIFIGSTIEKRNEKDERKYAKAEERIKI